jgi:two-component system, oxyanion-binding sensor
MMTHTQIRFGFIPLTDAAIPIVAHEMGFAAEEGIALELTRETSWATIRDRMAVGHFDAAHLLAPMPIASALKLMPLSPSIIVPMALGLGGNAVTVSSAVWRDMQGCGAKSLSGPCDMGNALRSVLQARAKAGLPKLVFGIVHPYSAHNYDLCYWLAECGIDPRHDISITVVSPPLLPDALQLHQLDGYCVGEPWNTASVALGIGTIVTTKVAIWRNSPEKVLGVNENWATQHPDALQALLRSFHRSAQWCAAPENALALASILSLPAYLQQSTDIILPALQQKLQIGDALLAVPAFLNFTVPIATLPQPVHAAWFYSQMVRWGQTTFSKDDLDAAMVCYRPDIYANANNLTIPKVQRLVGFFDSREFTSNEVENYLTSLPFPTA